VAVDSAGRGGHVFLHENGEATGGGGLPRRGSGEKTPAFSPQENPMRALPPKEEGVLFLVISKRRNAPSFKNNKKKGKAISTPTIDERKEGERRVTIGGWLFSSLFFLVCRKGKEVG